MGGENEGNLELAGDWGDYHPRQKMATLEISPLDIISNRPNGPHIMWRHLLAFQDKLTHVAMIDLKQQASTCTGTWCQGRTRLWELIMGPLKVYIFLDIKTLYAHTNRWCYNERWKILPPNYQIWWLGSLVAPQSNAEILDCHHWRVMPSASVYLGKHRLQYDFFAWQV